MPPRPADRNESVSRKRGFTVHLPPGAVLDQDAEWCILERDGEQQRIRFHDYTDIYNIPGLYEHLFYEKLECNSPRVVRNMISEVLEQKAISAADLSVLDVGAGNGMVGEELADLGAGAVIGVDILPAAAAAAKRDRPGVYQDYRIVDLTNVPENDDTVLRSIGFNCLTTVAALGFGDIPTNAFAQAYNYIRPDGLVAFTIKDRFVGDQDPSGFSRLIKQLVEDGLMTQLAERRYRHRLAVSGEPLHYFAYVAEKREDIPTDWF